MKFIIPQDYWSNGNYGLFDYRIKHLLFKTKMKNKSDDPDEVDCDSSGDDYHDEIEILNSKVSQHFLINNHKLTKT